jgi:hypothetical protein
MNENDTVKAAAISAGTHANNSIPMAIGSELDEPAIQSVQLGNRTVTTYDGYFDDLWFCDVSDETEGWFGKVDGKTVEVYRVISNDAGISLGVTTNEGCTVEYVALDKLTTTTKPTLMLDELRKIAVVSTPTVCTVCSYDLDEFHLGHADGCTKTRRNCLARKRG